MKRQKLKKYISNKLGMTYVELLCALSLLTLIVMAFTPMLLSSYETIYVAGERTEEVYNAQQELEEGLATRYSEIGSGILDISFRHNAEALFQNLNVRGRKVVSTLQDKFETIFHGARTRIDIISSDVVYDDTSSHEVILQTTGLVYDTVTLGTYSGNKEDMAQNRIHIEVFIPNKTNGVTEGTTTYELVYTTPTTNSALKSFDTNKGRIVFDVSGVDFTLSPVMIKVYYKNERGYLKTLTDYLFIEPTRLLLAGTTKNADYYTSSGVQEVDASTSNDSQITEFTLDVEARTMRLANSGLMTGSDSPKSKGVIIKTISWIPNDTNAALHPYYVMAGTNGSVYRMYNMANQGTIQEAMGSSNNVPGTPDGSLILDDGTYVYPSFWSGEMSDHYSFQTMYKSTTYGNAFDNVVDCSAPQSDSDRISGQSYVGTQYNKIDKNLRYSMMFNSFRTGYSYASQMSRKISYVLAEAGNKSFRIGGKKQDEGDFVGYHVPWEQPGDYKTFEGGMFSANTDDEQVIYLGGQGALAATNNHTDMHMAYIRLNTFTNINPFDAVKDNTNYGVGETVADRFVTGGEFWSPPGYSEESLKGLEWKNRENYINTKYGCNANITASVYLPGSGSRGQGQVIYFGTVPAYALVRQCSDIEKGDKKVYNTKNVVPSAATMYLVCGTQGNGTTIYRNAYSGAVGNKNEGVDAQNYMRGQINSGAVNTSYLTNPSAFYTTPNDSITYKLQEDNLEFTLGYCSRWRMAVGDVTYNGTTEETKSYEKYYTRSHSGEVYTRKPGSINGGGENNVYYNVWFPGEFYNLTVADTCDEVTVAVGYTVSGSTFMEQSHYASGYYGTALGSIYNDGVLAAYTSTGNSYTISGKGDKTTIFKNLLYYKSEAFYNSTTHSRKNIRFVAVGVNSETTKTTDQAGSKKYYAYYGDNYGNVYKSLVATASVSYNASSDTGTDETTKLVDYIADPVSTSGAPSTMQMITVNGSSLNTYFKEIVSIIAEEDIVIITGTPTSTAYNLVVVGTKDANGNWAWKTVKLGGYVGEIITSSYVVGGYYYVGVTDGTNNWIGATSLEALKTASNGHTLPPYHKKAPTDNCFIYNDIGDTIYAIAGRETV